MALQLDLFSDPRVFAAEVRPFLEQREGENALFLAVMESLQKAPPATRPLMARVMRDRQIVFAAIYREIHLVLTRGPDDAIDAAVARLATLDVELPRLLGPRAQAERFAQAWAAARGRNAVVSFDQLVYELTAVVKPPPTPGSLRLVAPEDLDLVTAWAVAFDREALPPDEHRTLEEARLKVGKRLAEGNLFLWEVDGQPVAMAGLARPTARTISVNAVYTPPAHRRRGYATALVAAVSEEGLRRGKTTCVLFTDLTNPTSNAIYRSIGYRPVCESRSYRFTAP